MPRGSNSRRMTDAEFEARFERNHGTCSEARAFERAASGRGDETTWAVFRELTTRAYPATARRRGAE